MIDINAANLLGKARMAYANEHKLPMNWNICNCWSRVYFSPCCRTQASFFWGMMHSKRSYIQRLKKWRLWRFWVLSIMLFWSARTILMWLMLSIELLFLIHEIDIDVDHVCIHVSLRCSRIRDDIDVDHIPVYPRWHCWCTFLVLKGCEDWNQRIRQDTCAQ